MNTIVEDQLLYGLSLVSLMLHTLQINTIVQYQLMYGSSISCLMLHNRMIKDECLPL